MLKRLSQGRLLPWMYAGHFNEILFPNEKKGKHEKNQQQIKEFQDAVEFAELRDLGFTGPAYTWSNGRRGVEFIWERLDRTLANDQWRNLFPIIIVPPFTQTIA